MQYVHSIAFLGCRFGTFFYGLLIPLFSVSFLVLMMLPSCQNVARAQNEQKVPTEAIKDTLNQAFPLPVPPLSMTSPREKAVYILEHYWDACNFDDPLLYTQHPAILERSFVDFLAIAQSLPDDVALPQLMTPANRACGELFDMFDVLYRKYLHEQEGAFVNERYYQAALEWFIASPKSSFAIVERDKHLLRIARLNEVGNVATNFSFVLANGEIKRLTDYTNNKYTLLIFFDPSCSRCEDTTRKLADDIFFSNMVATSQLNVLYISTIEEPPFDPDNQSVLPPFAVVGHNADGYVANVPLYDISKTPSIYLLDKRGKVLEKNATIEEIKAHLKSLLSAKKN